MRVAPLNEAVAAHRTSMRAEGATGFFRDLSAFQLLGELAERHAGPGPVRGLSAGCSTGPEAYSIAMTLRWAGLPPERITVEGFDTHAESIAAARAGHYGRDPDWLHRVPAARGLYFNETATGLVVKPEVARLVRFRVADAREAAAWQGEWDFIFCRYLVQWLPEAERAAVVARVRAALKPGGVVFIGGLDAGPFLATGMVRVDAAWPFALRN